MTCQETSRDLLYYVEDEIKERWYDRQADRRRSRAGIAETLFEKRVKENDVQLKRLFRIRHRELGR